MIDVASVGVTFGAFFVVCAFLLVASRGLRQGGRGRSFKRGSPALLGSGDGDSTPVEAQEIIGWRSWQVEDSGSELWLKSVVVPAYWQPGQALEAYFLPPPAGSMHGPGIYAAKSEAGALEALADWPGSVYGTVALWGTVIEHDRGYRAQFAYPQHLWCKDEETARRLSRRYGCESEVSERLSGVGSLPAR